MLGRKKIQIPLTNKHFRHNRKEQEKRTHRIFTRKTIFLLKINFFLLTNHTPNQFDFFLFQIINKFGVEYFLRYKTKMLKVMVWVYRSDNLTTLFQPQVSGKINFLNLSLLIFVIYAKNLKILFLFLQNSISDMLTVFFYDEFWRHRTCKFHS